MGPETRHFFLYFSPPRGAVQAMQRARKSIGFSKLIKRFRFSSKSNHITQSLSNFRLIFMPSRGLFMKDFYQDAFLPIFIKWVGLLFICADHVRKHERKKAKKCEGIWTFFVQFSRKTHFCCWFFLTSICETDMKSRVKSKVSLYIFWNISLYLSERFFLISSKPHYWSVCEKYSILFHIFQAFD